MKYLTCALLLFLGFGGCQAWAQDDAVLIINNGYSGSTVIATGTGNLSSSGTLTVGGTTTILSGGSFIGTLSENGTLGVGSSTGSLTLTISGSFDLSTFSSFTNTDNVVFNSPSFYTLNFDSFSTGATLSSDLTLDSPTLVLESSFAEKLLFPGSTYTLFTYQGTETGTFMYNDNPLPDGGILQWEGNLLQINYAEGDPSVTLTVVPEPSITSLFFFGAILLGLSGVRLGRQRPKPIKVS